MGAVQRKFLVLRQSKFPHLEMILVTLHTVGVSTHKLIPVGVIVTNRTRWHNSETVTLGRGKGGVVTSVACEFIVGREKFIPSL